MTDLERLHVESAARALVARCASLLDDRRVPELAETVFAEEALFVTSAGERLGGRAVIRRWFEAVAERPAGRHMTANTIVVVESPDRVTAQTDWIALSKPRDDGSWTVRAAGRYADVMERREGRWFIVRREVTRST